MACKLPGNASVVVRKARAGLGSRNQSQGADPSPPLTSIRGDTFGTHFPELFWLNYSNMKDGEKSLSVARQLITRLLVSIPLLLPHARTLGPLPSEF